MLFLALACGDLTPGERVLGEEVEAVTLVVETGQGRVVALSGANLISTDEPAMGQWASGSLTPLALGRARRVGMSESGPWAWLDDDTVISIPDGEVLAQLQQPTAVDRCPSGEIVATYGAGEAIACSTHGVLWTECEASQCSVLGPDLLDTVSPGGALTWFGGLQCWGSPMLDREEAPGWVRCSDGLEVAGMAGDHLGLSISMGRAAGRFNRHIVPPRLRIVSLVGDDTWIIDSAAENSRVGLGGDAEHFAVGVPEFRRGQSGGRIYVVEGS